MVFLLFVSHPLGVLVAGRDRLGPGRRRAAAAAAVVAGTVDHMRPAFFLFDRVLHLQVRHQEAALPVAEIQMADLRHAAHVHLRP